MRATQAMQVKLMREWRQAPRAGHALIKVGRYRLDFLDLKLDTRCQDCFISCFKRLL